MFTWFQLNDCTPSVPSVLLKRMLEIMFFNGVRRGIEMKLGMTESIASDDRNATSVRLCIKPIMSHREPHLNGQFEPYDCGNSESIKTTKARLMEDP